jgi:DNA-binding response OmpR family regulator
MPGLSGLHALDWFHKVRAWHAPVIVITAFGDAQTHAQARQLGAHVLDKPFDLDALRRTIAIARFGTAAR